MTMDMATSAYAWFGLLEAKAAGLPIPDNVAMDGQGLDTTDPNAVLQVGTAPRCGPQDWLGGRRGRAARAERAEVLKGARWGRR